MAYRADGIFSVWAGVAVIKTVTSLTGNDAGASVAPVVKKAVLYINSLSVVDAIPEG